MACSVIQTELAMNRKLTRAEMAVRNVSLVFIVLSPSSWICGPQAPLADGNGNVVGAHVTVSHVPIRIEFPVFVTVAPIPLAAFGVFPFTFKAHRHSIAGKRPQLLHQSIPSFKRPFVSEKILDRGSTMKRVFATPPDTIRRTEQGDLFRVTRVPRVFNGLNIFEHRFVSKWWNRKMLHCHKSYSH